MKVELFDVEEYIRINHIEEVKNASLFDRTGGPHPEGLVSNEIFGTTPRDRRETFAYINLHNHYLHPHVYKAIMKMFRNIEHIVAGVKYYSIDKDGVLRQDEENGETGIEFLYDNWEKIKWQRTEGFSRRNEIIDLITKHKKNEIFLQYFPVCPAYYRDIKTKANGSGETDDVNRMYAKLIRYSSLIENKSMFSFQFNNTNLSIQTTLVDIYNYFKEKLQKKNGLIRRSLMGKSIDYCVRTVITAANYHADSYEDSEVSYEYSSLPISQICTLLYPFIVRYVTEFFQMEVIDRETSIPVYDSSTDSIVENIKLDNPVYYFDDRYIKKMIDSYQKDPESRFTKIKLPVLDSTKNYYLAFSGKRYNSESKDEMASIVLRPMTYTDILYIACLDVTKNKCCLGTRYPILDEFGTFVTKIRVSSTTKTIPMIINGTLYKEYPLIDFSIPKEKVGANFIDTFRFSNSYLKGLDGDFDGDQVTIKIPFTLEANKECEEYMYRKENFLNASGKLIRIMENEAVHTFYVLTKNPDIRSKSVSKEKKEELLSLKPEDITLSKMIELFGYNRNSNSSKTSKIDKDKLNPNDVLILSNAEYPYIKEKSITTTVGRFIFYKFMIEGLDVTNYVDFINYPLTAEKQEDVDNIFATLLKEDKIDSKKIIKFIDKRDWFGLTIHSVITTSFTPGVIKTPKEVKKLKNELIKKYKKEIENGDAITVDRITKALIDKEMEVLKDDIGLDLYTSGARGSVSNNLKNINIIRGSILNTATGKFDIVTNSLLDGLEKKDIPASFNQIVVGSYARGVGTQKGGYLSKELMAACQNQVMAGIDTDCGTKKTIPIIVDKPGDFLYRYIQINGKTVLLTPENIDQYKGKELNFYSPMGCKGIENQNHICEKCGGIFYSRIIGKTNIGLLSTRLSGSVTKASLAKFHDSQVKLFKINIDDLLI